MGRLRIAKEKKQSDYPNKSQQWRRHEDASHDREVGMLKYNVSERVKKNTGLGCQRAGVLRLTHIGERVRAGKGEEESKD